LQEEKKLTSFPEEREEEREELREERREEQKASVER